MPTALPRLPDYLAIGRDDLGRGGPVRVRIVADAAALAETMADEMLELIRAGQQAGRPATLIVPVGPVDQFPILARKINAEQLDCRELMLINMDEYLDDQDRWLPLEHPLSFRAYMQRAFYDLLDPALAPRETNRVFPAPGRAEAIERYIQDRGGVTACFGGIGINGHIAFNEPPEPGVEISNEAFAARPAHLLDVARETRTINSVTVGGELSVIPRRAITVGMREILGAERLRFYCNRPWQSAVVRRVLAGPIGPACPASYLRTHADAMLTITEQVATVPEIRLR